MGKALFVPYVDRAESLPLPPPQEAGPLNQRTPPQRVTKTAAGGEIRQNAGDSFESIFGEQPEQPEVAELYRVRRMLWNQSHRLYPEALPQTGTEDRAAAVAKWESDRRLWAERILQGLERHYADERAERERQRQQHRPAVANTSVVQIRARIAELATAGVIRSEGIRLPFPPAGETESPLPGIVRATLANDSHVAEIRAARQRIALREAEIAELTARRAALDEQYRTLISLGHLDDAAHAKAKLAAVADRLGLLHDELASARQTLASQEERFRRDAVARLRVALDGAQDEHLAAGDRHALDAAAAAKLVAAEPLAEAAKNYALALSVDPARVRGSELASEIEKLLATDSMN